MRIDAGAAITGALREQRRSDLMRLYWSCAGLACAQSDVMREIVWILYGS